MARPIRPSDQPAPRRDPKPGRYQFGILPLLALTTLVGATLAAIRLTHWPVGFRIVMAAYAIVMLAYITLRIPFLLRQLRGAAGEWQKIRQDRKQFERLIVEHRRRRQADSATAQPPGQHEIPHKFQQEIPQAAANLDNLADSTDIGDDRPPEAPADRSE